MPVKLTLKDVQKFLDENDINKECTLLSSEYVNYSTPLEFICNLCGEKFKRDFAHIKRGRFCCQKCANKKVIPKNKLTLKDIQDYILKNDVNKECTLLSTDYIDNRTPLAFKCNICGKEFFRDANHLKRGRFRCEECGERIGAKKLKYSFDYVTEYLKEEGIQIIGEYINANTGVKCLCKEGHEFNLFFSEHLFRGRSCPICAIEKRSGINHWNYQGGGHQDVIDGLRHAIIPWKKECLKKANYCCDIGGKPCEDLVVHHLKNFRDIVEEALKNVNLPLHNYLNEYNDEEISQLKNEILRLHKVEDGVVISQQYHDEFHQIYGKIKNTKEQYLEFKNAILLRLKY